MTKLDMTILHLEFAQDDFSHLNINDALCHLEEARFYLAQHLKQMRKKRLS